MKAKSILSWYGSDASVAGEIAGLFSGIPHVSIWFAGGLSILPHLSARAILANDAHEDAHRFFRCMKREPERSALINECQNTLCHPAELEEARDMLSSDGSASEVMKAWAFWAQTWLQQKGTGGTENHRGVSARRSAGGGTNSSRMKSVAHDLEAWANLFKDVEFLCKDFREFADGAKDDAACGHYVDPPWVKEGVRYLHPFTEQDHRDLADIVDRFESSTVVLRYGDDPLLRELYPNDRWEWRVAESRTQASKKRSEVWICRNVTECFSLTS